MNVDNHNSQFSCTIDEQLLDKVTEHKDLEVVFDNVLKFHSHMSTIALYWVVNYTDYSITKIALCDNRICLVW